MSDGKTCSRYRMLKNKSEFGNGREQWNIFIYRCTGYERRGELRFEAKKYYEVDGEKS